MTEGLAIRRRDGLWAYGRPFFRILRDAAASAWLPWWAPCPGNCAAALFAIKLGWPTIPAPCCSAGRDGSALAEALPYDKACPRAGRQGLQALVPEGTSAASASSSLARHFATDQPAPGCALSAPPFRPDWLMGWLRVHWRWGEEANNLRLGCGSSRRRLAGETTSWINPEPQPYLRSVPSGSRLGSLKPRRPQPWPAGRSLPGGCRPPPIANWPPCWLPAWRGRRTASPFGPPTLVLKQFVDPPIRAPGVQARTAWIKRWLWGSLPTAVAAYYASFFSDQQAAAS